MQEKGRPCGPHFGPSVLPGSLRSQLADPRRPVGGRRARAGPVARTSARAQDVVTSAAGEERATPVGVVARVGDVLTGDPHRIAVHGGGTVVAPTRSGPGREARLLVAGEPVVGS